MRRIKIFPITVACIISLTLILFAVTKDQWIFAAKNNATETEDSQTAGVRLVVEKALQDTAEKDSNGDGIKDWQEALEKNSLGSSSGETKNSANTGGTETNKNTKDAQIAESGPKTQTDEISKALFAEYMQLKQSGNLNKDSMTNLVTKAVSRIDTSEVNSFTSSDIKTIPDSDVNGAKNYANAVVTIKEKYKNLYSQNPIITVGTRINFDDPASVQSIKSTSDLYKSINDELKKLYVPKSLVAAHVALLNNYLTSSEGLRELANLKTDPIAAMAGIQKHTLAATREQQILKSISQFFESRGIIFSVDEAGSRLNNL